MKLNTKRKSFSLLEVVFASTLLIMFLLSGIILMRGGINNVITSKHRLQAIYLANQKIEDLIAERDTNYFNGNYSLPSYPPILTETVTLNNIDFTRTTVVNNGPFVTDSKKITVSVEWDDYNNTNRIILYKYLTNWQSS